MGINKENYTTMLNISSKDIIIGLRRKIKLLEQKIKQLEYAIKRRATNENKSFNEDAFGECKETIFRDGKSDL